MVNPQQSENERRLEGPVLEDLLAEVRERFGHDADIVEANRIRKGGVGGFFARELYEVIVDADTAPSDTPSDTGHDMHHATGHSSNPDAGHDAAGTTTRQPNTLLDLVDAVDDPPAPAPRLARNGEPLASEEQILELLRRTEEPPVADPVPLRGTPTTLSTEGDAFAHVLDRITKDAGLSGGAHLATPSSPVVDDEPDAPFESYADVARRRRSADAAMEFSSSTPSVAPDTAVVHRPVASAPARAPEATVPAPEAIVLPDPAPVATAVPDAAVMDAAPANRARRGRIDEHGSLANVLDPGALETLGLPARMLTTPITARDRVGALVALAETFPRPAEPPSIAGGVIVLVGDRAGMQRTVEWMQEHLVLAPERLMLATRNDGRKFPAERRISEADEVIDLRRSWRRRRRPTLVVVDDPVSIRRTTWCRHVLDALEPDAVWGVVDASRKAEDVVAWGERIGGLDAVAVEGTDDTTSPAAILTSGLPVALLDGQPATPARWAALLDDRLLAA